MTTLIGVLFFSLAAFIMGYMLKWWLVRRSGYSGTIYVTHKDQKTLYSLELSDYPETLEFKKVVVFKVDASEGEDHIRE